MKSDAPYHFLIQHDRARAPRDVYRVGEALIYLVLYEGSFGKPFVWDGKPAEIAGLDNVASKTKGKPFLGH